MKQKNNSSDLVTKGFLEVKLQEVDDNARKYRDEILTKLDGVMGELKTMREETTIGAHQVFELREQVDSHEERITHLEELKLSV